MIAVVPSGPGVFGLAPFVSRRATAARSPRSAASRSVFSAADAREPAANSTTITSAMQCPALAGPAIRCVGVRLKADTTVYRISNLRQDAAAVTELLHRNVVAIEQRHQQIGKARVLRILQVLSAFNLSVRVTEDRRRQRIVVVLVAVAHIAAEEDRRVVE